MNHANCNGPNKLTIARMLMTRIVTGRYSLVAMYVINTTPMTEQIMTAKITLGDSMNCNINGIRLNNTIRMTNPVTLNLKLRPGVNSFKDKKLTCMTVSYTHLTLPTSDLV